MASPTTSTAWLTLMTTTWFTPSISTFPAANFTCPELFFGHQQHDADTGGGSEKFHIDSPTRQVADFIVTALGSVQTSISFACSYRVAAETGAVSSENTSRASTASPTHTTNTAPHPTATHELTHTKTNGGAIAGAAIGAALLGLMVGALIGYFCLSAKRRKRQDTVDPDNEGTAMTTFLPPASLPKERLSSKSSVRNEALLSSTGTTGGGSSSINNVLSGIGIHEGASDEEIKSELSALGYLLQEHVQNNYHLDPLDGSRNEVFKLNQALADPAFGLDNRTHALILKLSQDPQTRFPAIRHFLALTIFPALDLHHVRTHPGSVSLLPRQVTSFLESIPSSAAGMGKNSMTPQTATALNLWRRLSASLLLPILLDKEPSSNPISPSMSSPITTSTTSNILPPDEHDYNPNRHFNSSTTTTTVAAQVTSLRASLNKFLGIFVHSDRRAIFDQERNLEGVIQECVSFGYMLFAHGCEWRFVFAAPCLREQGGAEEEQEEEEEEEVGVGMQKGTMRLLALPGLEKLGDGKGEVYKVPKVVVEGETVAVEVP
ncbi:hypothetical protein GE21DRAFT_1884 [Neurospora crassa]|uniref:Uncharacterized protein n=1 Tax=Neurospora crassa (strain ATCC 24698 / 74-OR23-1A / CBS 708.71 / DSM 1257 / FGSC 987) TaxID=367110 RepID=Q7SEA8_NEUCR|nr:hypothetical protein NCU00826 [Neurospora crassa OR74A]EAA35133.1 hypothetical protein NCU00826 [Neurospora crassa OR74A]KHE79839.1 hypothetical protein GE21DRAFT_1884 [Neurospora crassa]|eukprot:XP_964369.1 hypothetical protein NCU00826 [Neurospora crassa OR74A]